MEDQRKSRPDLRKSRFPTRELPTHVQLLIEAEAPPFEACGIRVLSYRTLIMWVGDCSECTFWTLHMWTYM